MDPLSPYQEALKEFAAARTVWAAVVAGGGAPMLDEKELHDKALQVLGRSEGPEDDPTEQAVVEHLRVFAARYLHALEKLSDSLDDLRKTLDAIRGRGVS